jgi:hypothetical protein
MKHIIASIFLLTTFFVNAQVTGVKYKLVFNEQTALYEAYLIVTEGSASSVMERIQFNSLYTILTPKEITVTVKEDIMPLENNQNYMGTEPMDWRVTNTAFSPNENPDLNYFGISPQLSPTALYNDLNAGDEVLLFTLEASPLPVCFNDVRLLDNELDPKDLVNDGNFTSGFTIGGLTDVYKGNEVYNIPLALDNGSLTTLALGTRYFWYDCETEGAVAQTTQPFYTPEQSGSYYVIAMEGECSYTSECVDFLEVSTTEPKRDNLTIFPNPTSGLISIKSEAKIKEVSILSFSGREILLAINNPKNIDLSELANGVYFLKLKQSDSIIKYHKVIISK